LAYLYTRLSADEPPVLIISRILRSYGASPATSRAISRQRAVRLPIFCDRVREVGKGEIYVRNIDL
jgi:hypothetical protein